MSDAKVFHAHLWGTRKRKYAELRDSSDGAYRTHVEGGSPGAAANTLICLIHEATYLLDQQLRALDRRFLDDGGFTEALYRTRRARRDGQP